MHAKAMTKLVTDSHVMYLTLRVQDIDAVLFPEVGGISARSVSDKPEVTIGPFSVAESPEKTIVRDEIEATNRFRHSFRRCRDDILTSNARCSKHELGCASEFSQNWRSAVVAHYRERVPAKPSRDAAETSCADAVTNTIAFEPTRDTHGRPLRADT